MKKMIGGFMKNFSDFIFEEEKNNSSYVNKDNLQNSNETEIKENNLNESDIENLINKYSSYSDNDLMKEFLKMTMERKKTGGLKDDELEVLKSTILPHLNDEQKKSLEYLLEMIRNV